MKWPWVSRLSYETKCEALVSARETIAALSGALATERTRYDALADKYVAHGTPVTLPTKQRDPVLDAISERAAGHPDLLRFLGVYARKARREHVPDDEIIATVSNWNRTERDLDNGEGLPD